MVVGDGHVLIEAENEVFGNVVDNLCRRKTVNLFGKNVMQAFVPVGEGFLQAFTTSKTVVRAPCSW